MKFAGRLRNLRSGTVTISGLSRDDCALIAEAVRAGAFSLDRGGPRAEAADRFASLLRIPVSFPEQHAPIVFTTGDDPADRFHEVYNGKVDR